ncbi:MAG: Hsp33 family molecular chaperone HslO [Lachnospiraceae bacterium]|nr:Hsp33 family molecular chaperone HslO [Lachnospiraceae bacterium]
MSDYVLRGMAADGQILAFAAVTSEMVEEARKRHGTTPVATAALGRTMTAAAMMACQLKGTKESLTIQIEGSGPIGKIITTADGSGAVRGYVSQPKVELPPKEKGKLDVAAAVGIGVMNIVKDLGLKEPYVGSTHLVSSEIAEDLAYYFTVSEQIPSAVALGVLVNKDESVWTAGGYIFQMMPGASDEIAEKLQEKVTHFPPISKYLAEGHTPEELLQDMLGEFDYHTLDKVETRFQCNCTRERVSAALMSIGEKDLQELIDEGETIEMSCHFCNEKYLFSVEEMQDLLKKIQR